MIAVTLPAPPPFHRCLFLTVPLLHVRTADFEFKAASFKFNSITQAPFTSCTASTTLATIYLPIATALLLTTKGAGERPDDIQLPDSWRKTGCA